MPVDGERVINPAMHHINIKTTKLQEMIDWYGLVSSEGQFSIPYRGVHFK